MKFFHAIGIVVMMIGSLVKEAFHRLFFEKKKPPKPEPIWEEVDCSECNGKGKVTYGPDHDFVKNGWAEANVAYTCSICGGSGKLMRREL